jgi:hypothetical protein
MQKDRRRKEVISSTLVFPFPPQGEGDQGCFIADPIST